MDKTWVCSPPSNPVPLPLKPLLLSLPAPMLLQPMAPAPTSSPMWEPLLLLPLLLQGDACEVETEEGAAAAFAAASASSAAASSSDTSSAPASAASSAAASTAPLMEDEEEGGAPASDGEADGAAGAVAALSLAPVGVEATKDPSLAEEVEAAVIGAVKEAG